MWLCPDCYLNNLYVIYEPPSAEDGRRCGWSWLDQRRLPVAERPVVAACAAPTDEDVPARLCSDVGNCSAIVGRLCLDEVDACERHVVAPVKSRVNGWRQMAIHLQK